MSGTIRSDIVTYECTVHNSGEESGFVYISRFRTVARLQRPEIERAGASKQGSLFGSGFAGLGAIGAIGAIRNIPPASFFPSRPWRHDRSPAPAARTSS